MPVTKFCISAPSVSFRLLHDAGAGNSGTAFTCYQLVYYAALSAAVWMTGSGAPWWSEGSTRCQEEGGAIWSFLSASYSGELVLSEIAVPPIISLADPVCLCLFRDARTSCLESALQRWEFQLCGVSSASFWILQWPTSFHCSPAQGWQLFLAVAISCSVFCLFSHPVNNSLGYIFSVKYLVYNSCILTGSHWRQWIETKSLIMLPMSPKSVSQTLPERLNIFPSHLIFFC